MNLAELERKLTAAARANTPGDNVPFAFEKRVMGQIAALRRPDYAAVWARALWRGAFASVLAAFAVCAGVVLLAHGPDQQDSLPEQFENAMLAAVAQEPEVDL